MNLQKSIQAALLLREYKTKKAFCEEKGISQSLLSRICKGGTNKESKLASVILVAAAFDLSVSEFIKLGE